MKTSVVFSVADSDTLKPTEDAYKQCLETGFILQRAVADSLRHNGFNASKVGPGIGMGCAVGLSCYMERVEISSCLSILPVDTVPCFKYKILNWVGSPLWRQVLRLTPTAEQESEALSLFCRLLGEVLSQGKRCQNFDWMTLEEGCAGKSFREIDAQSVLLPIPILFILPIPVNYER